MKLSEIKAMLDEKKEVKGCPCCGSINILKLVCGLICNVCHVYVSFFNQEACNDRPIEDKKDAIIRGLVSELKDTIIDGVPYAVRKEVEENIGNTQIEVEGE